MNRYRSVRSQLPPSTQEVNESEISLMFGRLASRATQQSLTGADTREDGCFGPKCPFNQSCDRSDCRIFDGINAQ